jgi:hypothetical protein
VLQEDLQRDPQAAYVEVLQFLGVGDDGRAEFPAVNSHKVHRFPRLARFLMYPPFPFGAMKNGLKTVFGWDGTETMSRIYRRLSHTERRVPLREEFRRELVEYFRSDVERLERLLGRPLDEWKH